jgi:8-oxo-dGTP pyrophosphatase MutT (NUDIX family)
VKILAEIHRRPEINTRGKTIYRTAVRAVIQRGYDLLMVYSANVGDYKFPGGGTNEGESHEQTLRREVNEECGALLVKIGKSIGSVIEYNIPMEAEYGAFKMTSHYYFCQVEDGFGAQKLDAYEKDLGFKPVWVNIDQAISTNRFLLNADKIPEWLKREIFVLEYIKQMMLAT